MKQARLNADIKKRFTIKPLKACSEKNKKRRLDLF